MPSTPVGLHRGLVHAPRSASARCPRRPGRGGAAPCSRSCARRGDPPRVEPALQQHRRRDRIDHLAPALSPYAAFDERTLGDRGRETLVPELDRRRGAALRARPRMSARCSAASPSVPSSLRGKPMTTRVHLAIFHLARDARPYGVRDRSELSQAVTRACMSRRRWPDRPAPSRRRCREPACGRYRPRLGGHGDLVGRDDATKFSSIVDL